MKDDAKINLFEVLPQVHSKIHLLVSVPPGIAARILACNCCNYLLIKMVIKL